MAAAEGGEKVQSLLMAPVFPLKHSSLADTVRFHPQTSLIYVYICVMRRFGHRDLSYKQVRESSVGVTLSERCHFTEKESFTRKAELPYITAGLHS